MMKTRLYPLFLLLGVFTLLAFVPGKKKYKELEDGLYAEITTNRGVILLSLEYEKCPMTVGNFVGLAEGMIPNDHKGKGEPYFDGIKFHRVIPNFMIQGGDPLGKGSGGPGYKFPNEIHPELKHDSAGILSMANAGPGTNGSQFFITHKETPWLNGKHTVFGQVVQGQDVVNAIQKDDVMETIRIIRKGKAAKKFNGAKTFLALKEKLEADAKAAAEADRKAFENLVLESYPDAKTTESGLMYYIEKEGTGKQAQTGNTVTVHYTGRLQGGAKFDSSRDRGKPITFPLGQNRVIKGWEEGITLFKEGGKGKLFVPYNLAYGEMARGKIPSKANLIFDIELLKVQ